jgi:two-component system CheB/CheR fusion protein
MRSTPSCGALVIFGRHDLVQDAPMSRLDLLICRNTLMYFNSETQNRILSRFNYAVNPNGFLFLGKAEMLLIHSSLFSPVELKHPIFSKLGQVHLRERLSVFAQNDGPAANHEVSRNIRLQETVFEAESPPKVVIDAGGVLIWPTSGCGNFSVSSREISAAFFMTWNYRTVPPIYVRLIEQAYAEREKTVSVNNVERRLRNGDLVYLNIRVVPLMMLPAMSWASV